MSATWQACLAWMVSVWVTGCLRGDVQLCGDRVCPGDQACTAGGRCVDQDQLAACVGLANSAVCTWRDEPGRCRDGACSFARCGDGLLDAPEERCDDGNTVDGDGCSGTCRSDELCGNGVVDVDQGELCDTGPAGVAEDGNCPRCQLTRCGDGFAYAGVEPCDDGNLDPTDGCVTFVEFAPGEWAPICDLPRCGDGWIQAGIGETCDDGNTDDAAEIGGCDSNCTVQGCGNGICNEIGPDGAPCLCETDCAPCVCDGWDDGPGDCACDGISVCNTEASCDCDTSTVERGPCHVTSYCINRCFDNPPCDTQAECDACPEQCIGACE